jgi:hypothetical protein
MEEESSKTSKKDWQLIAKAVLIIIGLAILGYLIWVLATFIYSKEQTTGTTPVATPSQEEETVPACASTLTDADKGAMVGWKTYTNGTRGYSFKYPQTWWISRASEDYVTLRENEAKINLDFKSGNEAVLETTGYTLSSSDARQIACEPTTLKNYKKADYRMMTATFTKDGMNYVIQESYQDLGASISGDIVDAWNLTLKSIEF